MCNRRCYGRVQWTAGLLLVFLPPYTPELQPAETLWTIVDEPIVNRHIETLGELETIIAQRCVALTGDLDRIKSQAKFHWWPDAPAPN